MIFVIETSEGGRSHHEDDFYSLKRCIMVGCVAQWLERRSLTGELSLASARSAPAYV